VSVRYWGRPRSTEYVLVHFAENSVRENRRCASLCQQQQQPHVTTAHPFDDPETHTERSKPGFTHSRHHITIQSPDVYERLLFVCDKLSITPHASKERSEAAQMRVKSNVSLLQASLNKGRSSSRMLNEPAKLIKEHSFSYCLKLL
jgi:hypothetical protein